jgi:hypothetical protein
MKVTRERMSAFQAIFDQCTELLDEHNETQALRDFVSQ